MNFIIKNLHENVHVFELTLWFDAFLRFHRSSASNEYFIIILSNEHTMPHYVWFQISYWFMQGKIGWEYGIIQMMCTVYTFCVEQLNLSIFII